MKSAVVANRWPVVQGCFAWLMLAQVAAAQSGAPPKVGVRAGTEGAAPAPSATREQGVTSLLGQDVADVETRPDEAVQGVGAATASSTGPAAQGEAEDLQLDVSVPEGPRHPWWISGELGASFLSNLVERSSINLAFHYGAKLGHRFSASWGAFFELEHNPWVETEIQRTVHQGALNIGLGLELLYFAERMRLSLAVGPSVLLQETALDSPGSVGLFVDVHPAGIRWPVSERVVLMLDPLTFTLVSPVLGGIPLTQIQYRTVFTVEYGLGH